jgi:hypothetical protein
MFIWFQNRLDLAGKFVYWGLASVAIFIFELCLFVEQGQQHY